MQRAAILQLHKQQGISLNTRPSSNERGYTHRWRDYAANYLKVNPLCVECLRQNRTTASQCVDHIKPHKGNQELFWNPKNHQALCFECHNRKTMKESSFGNNR